MKNKIKSYLVNAAICLLSVSIAFAIAFAIASARIPLY